MPNKQKKETFDFKTALAELEEINRWFQEEDIDLDEGLKKLKRGKELIKKCKERIKDVENEYIAIKVEGRQITDTDEPS